MKEWFPNLKESPDQAPYPTGGALLAELGPDEFLLTEQRVRVNFGLGAGRKAQYVNGKWVVSRLWNGDQTDYGLNLTNEPRLLRVRLATY
jgi:hypothetical protein